MQFEVIVYPAIFLLEIDTFVYFSYLRKGVRYKKKGLYFGSGKTKMWWRSRYNFQDLQIFGWQEDIHCMGMQYMYLNVISLGLGECLNSSYQPQFYEKWRWKIHAAHNNGNIISSLLTSGRGSSFGSIGICNNVSISAAKFLLTRYDITIS